MAKKRSNQLAEKVALAIGGFLWIASTWAIPPEINIQGKLQTPDGGPLTGPHAFWIGFYDVPMGGAPISEMTRTVTLSEAGRFTLPVPFEPALLESPELWYELSVGANDDGLDAGDLFPSRTPILSVPYALLAANSETLAGTPAHAFAETLEVEAWIATRAPAEHEHLEEYWSVAGNIWPMTETRFLGSVLDQRLEIGVGGVGAFQIHPSSGTPNLVGGYLRNEVAEGAVGAAIAGGGENGFINRVTDDFGFVGGGRNNQAGDGAGTLGDRAYATIPGGAGNLAAGIYATVGGGLGNQATANYAAIAGGGRSDPVDPSTGNRVTDEYGTVGGGGNNQAGNNDMFQNTASYATVSGGVDNEAGEQWTTVGGGAENVASGLAATVSGGLLNSATANDSTVGGGSSNAAGGDYSTISGGDSNIASGRLSTIGGGGAANTLFSNHATGESSTIGGGTSNKATADYATVSGGGLTIGNDPDSGNRVSDDYGTVGGGGDNLAGDASGTVLDASFATVAGGQSNEASGAFGFVGGGKSNGALLPFGTVGGGENNVAVSSGGTIAGGRFNSISASFGVIGGGGYTDHSEGNNVTGGWGTVGGGRDNWAGATNASVGDDAYATVGGGRGNDAPGEYSTIPGGRENETFGKYSFAAGRNAKADHNGAIVFADSQDYDFTSSANNEFSARCTGGARFISGILNGFPATGVVLAPGTGAWGVYSDRNGKENVRPANGREVLGRLAEVPISTWNYKTQDSSIRHMGPMAQDFHEAFGLGEDDKHITTVDTDGVALAAIQALSSLLEEKEAEIEELKKRMTALEDRYTVDADPESGAPVSIP